MIALHQIESVLLRESLEIVSLANIEEGLEPGTHTEEKGLAGQLKDLRRALDQGLITRAECDRKRAEIVERY